MAELKLRNCPFCGEKAEVRISLGRDIVSCTNCHAEMTGSYINIDSLIEEWNTRESPAVNRWIPCSERLPETPYEGFGVHFLYSDCVLVAAKDWMGMAYYLTEEGKSWWEFADAQTKQRIDWVEITHWMPLPEPPESEVQHD